MATAAINGTLQDMAGSSPLIVNASQTEAQRTFLGLIGVLILALPRILIWFITFTTAWMFTLLSTSLTLTVNMTTLLLIMMFFVSIISWVVRYRYMNMYSRLPPTESGYKEAQVEVFPDTQGADSKPGLANYLDEFLSAIKVFGYLERPVFHELTRTMQTRKLIAGETLLLEEEKGFCLVVDGLVQIFVKSNKDRDDENGPDDGTLNGDDSGVEEGAGGNQGYSLLTEVKNGAPMSSLFSILSLFTEDVKLRHDEKEDGTSNSVFPSNTQSGSITPGSGVASPVLMSTPSRPVSQKNLAAHNEYANSAAQSAVPPLSLDPTQGVQADDDALNRAVRAEKRKRSKKYGSAHPDIVARASVDTTIAVIPATAFHRLTRVYPKATAHIVQVILARLQRVTMATGHTYLGLTSEVLRTERLMDRYTSWDLPDFLRGAALERLKDKFRKVVCDQRNNVKHFLTI